jgi:hypothetical protein
MPKKKTSVALRKEKEMKKEELELEGYKPLPKEKMARQADKAYGKEQRAVAAGDEKEANKQMQRRIAMKDPAGRKAALTKEELEGNPVYEATKADIKEFVDQALNSAGQALSTPVGAGLAAGTVGAVTGGKKKVKKSLATGAGAAAGAALGGLPGAVVGGIAGNALS